MRSRAKEVMQPMQVELIAKHVRGAIGRMRSSSEDIDASGIAHLKDLDRAVAGIKRPGSRWNMVDSAIEERYGFTTSSHVVFEYTPEPTTPRVIMRTRSPLFYEDEVAQALSAAEPSEAELVRVFDSSWGDGPYADMNTRPTIDVALLGSAGRHPRHDSARIKMDYNRETHLVGVRGHVPGVNRLIPDRLPYARTSGRVSLFEFGTIRDGVNRAARSRQ